MDTTNDDDKVRWMWLQKWKRYSGGSNGIRNNNANADNKNGNDMREMKSAVKMVEGWDKVYVNEDDKCD